MINNNQNYLDLSISYPNIDIFLGGGLEELEAEAVGELLAPLVADDPLVLHVALVAHQDHLRVVPAVRLDLGAPEVDSLRVIQGNKQGSCVLLMQAYGIFHNWSEPPPGLHSIFSPCVSISTHQSCTLLKDSSLVTSYIRMKPMAPL